MKKFEDLEDIINFWLTKFGRLIASGKLYSHMAKKSSHQMSKVKTKASKTKASVITNGGDIKQKAKAAHVRSLFLSRMLIAKAYELPSKIRTLKINPAVIIAGLTGIFSFLYKKVLGVLASLQPQTILTFVAISTISSLAGITIYSNSKTIVEGTSREPAQVEEVEVAGSARPKYWKKHEKVLLLDSFYLPIYRESISTGRMLRIDVSITASNRYIREFFFKNDFYLRDKINSTIEPIDADFLLEDEGKTILKKKLLKELNVLVDELEIEGSIESIDLHSYLNG